MENATEKNGAARKCRTRFPDYARGRENLGFTRWFRARSRKESISRRARSRRPRSNCRPDRDNRGDGASVIIRRFPFSPETPPALQMALLLPASYAADSPCVGHFLALASQETKSIKKQTIAMPMAIYIRHYRYPSLNTYTTEILYIQHFKIRFTVWHSLPSTIWIYRTWFYTPNIACNIKAQ